MIFPLSAFTRKPLSAPLPQRLDRRQLGAGGAEDGGGVGEFFIQLRDDLVLRGAGRESEVEVLGGGHVDGLVDRAGGHGHEVGFRIGSALSRAWPDRGNG